MTFFVQKIRINGIICRRKKRDSSLDEGWNEPTWRSTNEASIKGI